MTDWTFLLQPGSSQWLFSGPKVPEMKVALFSAGAHVEAGTPEGQQRTFLGFPAGLSGTLPLQDVSQTAEGRHCWCQSCSSSSHGWYGIP